MNTKNFQIFSKVMDFKKWQSENYSVFNSIGKYIRIGVVSFTYSLVMMTTPTYAQTDSLTVSKTLDLDEIIVSGQRAPVVYSRLARVVNTYSEEALELMPASSLQDALDYSSGIDVRQRGPMGVQADLSIRGGSFDQNLVLLNGIDITDPQTGHFALNLPVNLSDVKEIEILKGPGSRIFGPNAFKGAINFITQPSDTNMVNLRLIGGKHKFIETAANANFTTQKTRHFISLSYRSSEGYIENTDFDISNIFYHGIYDLKGTSFNFQAGYKNKAFGAQSFFTPEYPNQFEENSVYFTSLTATRGNKLKIEPSVYWRRHQDRFELFRETNGWYERSNSYFIRGANDTAKFVPGVFESFNYYSGHNYHRTDIYGAKLNFSYHSFLGQTSLGVDFRSEKILSNVLGDPMNDTIYMKSHPYGYFNNKYSRQHYNAYLEHVYYLNNFTVSAGILANYSKEYDQKWKFYPGVDVSYRFSNSFKLFGSVNKSLRLPTFTDLFYEGPSNKGNPDLIPESITSYEAGIKVSEKTFNGYLSLFYSEADNLIAWVLFENSESSQYKTRNLTEVVNKGIELDLNAKLSIPLIEKVSFSYTYIDQEKITDGFDSKYSLSYLKHKITANLTTHLGKNWYVTLGGTYRDRNGAYRHYDFQAEQYTRDKEYKPYFLFDGKFHWRYNTWKIFLEASNILNKKYTTLGNIEMPGRWVRVGLVKKFGL